MAHTRTWNTAYEALPADGNDAKNGASRIRDFKIDVRERMALDHSWDSSNPDDTNDGYHEKVTFLNQTSDPAAKANGFRLYAKDDDVDSELWGRDEAGNIIQITRDGKLALYEEVGTFEAGQHVLSSTLTDGATVTPNCNTSNFFVWTIGGNRTLANPSNPKDGFVITIRIKQDGTGGRTITYGSKWKFPNGTSKALSTGAGDIDLLTAIYDLAEDKWYAALNKDYV